MPRILDIRDKEELQAKDKSIEDNLELFSIETENNFFDVNDKISNLETKHNNDISQLTNKHNQDISSLTNKHNQEISTLTNKHNQELSALGNKHDTDITNLTNKHNKDISDLTDKHDRELLALTNTHNADKTTLQSNIDTVAATQKKYTDDSITALINGSPDLLNTLDELAAALGDDENFAATMTTQLAAKVDKTTYTTDKAGLTMDINTNAINILSLEIKHDNELATLKNELKANIDDNSTAISNLASTHETDKNSINQSISDLTTSMNTQLDTKVDNFVYTSGKTELETSISNEKTRAQLAEEALNSRLIPVETFLKSAEINAEDQTVIDTLKEIQDYITSDKTGASEMLSSIQENTNAILGKQDALIFDEKPKDDSENPVTSAGIKTYVDNAIAPVVITITDGVADKTMVEIFNLYKSGVEVKLEYDYVMYYLDYAYTKENTYSYTDSEGMTWFEMYIEYYIYFSIAYASDSNSAYVKSIRLYGIDDNYGTLSEVYTANLLTNSGGVMTGALTLSGEPTNDLHAVTKQYVDNQVSRICNGTSFILQSSTPDSTKKFAITVDDSGVLTATEIV